jgi:hypothetical protein
MTVTEASINAVTLQIIDWGIFFVTFLNIHDGDAIQNNF